MGAPVKLTTNAPAAALLAELVRLGIELRADGDSLRFRPRSAMTPALARRLLAVKPELLALLTECDPTKPRYTVAERRMLADAPADLRNSVDEIKALWPDAEVVAVRNPRQRLADLMHAARRAVDTDRAQRVREAWRERAAIIEFDGGISRGRAEALALSDVLASLAR